MNVDQIEAAIDTCRQVNEQFEALAESENRSLVYGQMVLTISILQELVTHLTIGGMTPKDAFRATADGSMKFY